MDDGGNLLASFHAAATDRLDESFLVDPDATTLRYREVFDRAAAMAAAMRARGVQPGDRVLVQVAKSTDAVALYLACLHAGAIHVPLNPAFTPAETAFFIAETDPALVVDDAALAALAQEATATDPLPLVDRDDDDIAAILFTSGTTGKPKGAALTHANLRHNAGALHDIWRFGPEDRLLHTLPLFHVHGLFVALHCALLSAIPVVLLRRFSVDAVIAELPHTTVLMGVPTHYGRLLGDNRFDHALTAGVRLFTSGSAPLSEAVFESFTERTGHRICERYGMSEAGIITSNPYDGPRIAGTVGFPLPGVSLRVVDDTGAELEPGTTGEVEIAGPHLFSGYWRNPDATAAAHRDGFFRTGDVGSVDAEGRLSLQGRAGDMIISGGENVYPKEVELVLDTVDGIAESAVIGLAHPDFGEGVTAVVVVDGPVDDDALGAALDAALARYKHPKQIVTVDALPRNAMGKVQKSELRDRFGDLYSTETAD